MKVRCYENFEDWKKDLDKVHKNPNDKELIMHVKRRVDISSEVLKHEIHEYLMDRTFETNPWAVFERVAYQNPDFKVLVKSDKDPWFLA